MKQFMATQVELARIYDMPESWSDANYRCLLQQLEIEDIDDLSATDLLTRYSFTSLAIESIVCLIN